MTRKLKIFFHVMDLLSAQNTCIGLGQDLLKRGHQVFFLVNEQFANRFSKYGFVEYLLNVDETRIKRVKTCDYTIDQLCTDYINLGFFANLSTLDKMKKLAGLTFFDLMRGNAIEFESQIKTLLEKEKPDLIVINSYIVAPCLINANVPYVYLYCSNPIGFFDSDELPPMMSGYPIDSESKLWEDFRKIENEVVYGAVVKYQQSVNAQFGYPNKVNQRFICHSPHLNIYPFPEELDYHDVIAIPDNFRRIDTCMRQEDGQFEFPVEFQQKIPPGGKLILVALGSMASVDVKLMKRLVTILSKTSHYYIFSTGRRHNEYALGDNMWGEAFLPQTKILPLVDMAIMHGGNNSLIEAATFGKPIIVMPLFYDQFANAQRVQEKGFGVRIEPYDFEDQQLVDAIELILGDQNLKDKYVKMAKRIAQSNSREKACTEMEKLAIRGISSTLNTFN